MPQLGGALANVLLLLDVPDRPAVGQAGLAGTALYAALEPITDRLVDLTGEIDPPGRRELDLVIARGKYDSQAWQALRSGGWLLLLRDFNGWRKRSISTPASQTAEVRHWLVSPGFYFPYAIVPYTRVAMRAHELATREPDWKRAIRLAAIFFGSPAREFTGELIAARKS